MYHASRFAIEPTGRPRAGRRLYLAGTGTGTARGGWLHAILIHNSIKLIFTTDVFTNLNLFIPILPPLSFCPEDRHLVR